MTTFLLKSFVTSVVKRLKDASNYHKIRNRKANFHLTRRNLEVKCPDGPVYTTRLALPPDYDNVVEFMCEEYYKGEPIVHNIGMKGTEAPECWRQLMYEQVRAGLSIIAVNQDHCIIGAALNAVIIPSEWKTLREFAKTCEPVPIRRIIEFYSYVAKEVNVWERYCVWQVFEQSCVAVSSDFRGMGIAKKLIAESWHLARDCSYSLFLIQCNSRYCAKICENFGWEMIWSIPFDKYVHGCEAVFKHIKEPHTVSQVFVDRLRKCKPYCKTCKKCEKITYPPKLE
ncbi:arylalkylamine N-acetyltransferase 1 [Colletes latitarsis]|uniref:arylalkylamine N-acetyltransferase 1 n=1 Tax=Colletes latitarsis TaxID=2605962 RepID=UPI0040373EBE